MEEQVWRITEIEFTGLSEGVGGVATFQYFI